MLATKVTSLSERGKPQYQSEVTGSQGRTNPLVTS
jgi:hypothetical protein